MPASQTPDELLRQLGITEPGQIDLDAVAFHCGAIVKYRPLDGCAARIVGTPHKAIITVDERSSRQRQRFSIGHELGHWLCDRGAVSMVCQSTDLSNFRRSGINREARANRFAAELLMPSYLFRSATKGKSITLESVRELARLFNSSLTATAIRLVELGHFPSAVASYSMNGQNWICLNKEVPDTIRITKHLDSGSIAYRLLRSDGMQTGPTEVDADVWVSHPEAYRYTIWEDSVRISANETLSLLWWKDERLLCDSSE